jgi:glycine/D-amino acid oxidase-like deaminating enzyme
VNPDRLTGTCMADVCVVGGGPAGMAVAARAAKNGHAVTLLDAAARLGGRLRTELVDGAVVETGAADMVLPATLRDLYRKTGRPLEREVGLDMIDGTRDHRELPTLDHLDLPLTGRGAQQAAVALAAGPDAARLWTGAMDRAGEMWTAAHGEWENLPHATRHAFRFSRTENRSVLFPIFRNAARTAGVTGGAVPGLVACRPYLEQALGVWRPTGGSAALADNLVDRLFLRGVTVQSGHQVTALLGHADGSVAGVRTSAGDQPADVAVLTVGVPEIRRILDHTSGVRGLRPLRYRLRQVRPAPVPRVTLATLDEGSAPAALETVFHRQSAVVRRHEPRADGTVPVTVLRYAATRHLPLPAQPGAEIAQPPFACGPSLASIRRLLLLPHIHGQVPGLMVAGPSTHLAGLLSTELLSAAIAAEALGRTPR